MNAPAPSKGGWKRWRGRLVVAAVVIVAGLLLWNFAGHQVGVRRSAPRIATITPLPPPPPPPKEKPPEPKKVEEDIKPIDKPMDQPQKPVDAPKPTNDTAKSVTINGDAQAGSDNFNIGAGDGGGMVGSGGGSGTGTGSYGQYLGYAIQQAVQRDDADRGTEPALGCSATGSGQGHALIPSATCR